MSDAKKVVVNELHKPARINFPRRRVIVKGIDDLLQADLVEMIPYHKSNKGFKYILMVINVFSKFVWAFPIKKKTGEEVTAAMSKIIKNFKPKNIQTDMGKEFYNKSFNTLMSENGINHYSTFSTLKSSVVERVNRTIKNLMWKEFSYQGNYKWLDLLPKIVAKYNNTKHSTTNYKPVEVNKRNEKEILRNVYTFHKVIDPHNPKFKLGDMVRISKYRHVFHKGYFPNWSNEIFQIAKVQTTSPRTYILQDENKELIKGGFYEAELQKVQYRDVYLIEKVLRKKGNKLYVKWLGMDKNSWINKSDLT